MVAEDRLEAIESYSLVICLMKTLHVIIPSMKIIIASTLSVEGTPYYFLQDGRIPGYQNHQDIMAFIYK